MSDDKILVRPPSRFVASAVQPAMVGGAERNGELVADPSAKGAWLSETEMVRKIAWGASAHETGLAGDEFAMLFIAQPSSSSHWLIVCRTGRFGRLCAKRAKATRSAHRHPLRQLFRSGRRGHSGAPRADGDDYASAAILHLAGSRGEADRQNRVHNRIQLRTRPIPDCGLRNFVSLLHRLEPSPDRISQIQ